VGEARGTRRCPRCGGLNPPGAPWCGQCLTAFADEDHARPAPSEDDAETAPRVARPPAPGAAADSAIVRGAFRVSDDGITWRCRVCESVNPLEAAACRVCGATLAETLRPPEPDGPIRDPGTAALLSLFLPGAGHAYLGLWGQAAARAVTAAWVGAVAVAAAAGRGVASPPAVLFALVSFALWVVSAHDAYRESQRDRASVLLAGRSFLWAVVGLLLLSVVMLFASTLGTRPG
jgi:hypothetical protein